MAWLWEGWEEFVRHVQPVAVQRGRFQHASHATELELLGDLLEAVHDLRKANGALATLGFNGKKAVKPTDKSTLHEAHNRVIEAVYAGEALLLFHKRLTLSEASYGFLHAHDILEHWDRYAATTRIQMEIHRLTEDVDLLLQGYDRLVREDERLLVNELDDLPEELERDFQAARNLFSIGLDDIGLFIAGRGLEKVLRRIARDRKLFIVRGKPVPAEDADFYDLIEALSRVRWKTRKASLISTETKALHYLRSIRNRGAHKGHETSAIEGAREKACVVAKTAAQLWESVDGTRAQLAPTNIPKDW
jgi:hypothetical protein